MTKYPEFRRLLFSNPEWRTRYAVGVCDFFAEGGDKTREETLLESAVCAAIFWDKDPQLFDEKYAQAAYGKEIWEKAKQIVREVDLWGRVKL